MKTLPLSLLFLMMFKFSICNSQSQIISIDKSGLYELNEEGASYFARLSLDCVDKTSPHYYDRYKTEFGILDNSSSKDYWPSFYGCFDWHSSVHNHWCLVKLLKKYPDIPEANEIQNRLEYSFSTQNIKRELDFFENDRFFEFPYGQSWMLKLADELKSWDDPLAAKWLKQIEPLLNFIEQRHLTYWSNVDSVAISGSHDSPAMGISFALDYSRSFQKNKLEKLLVKAAKKYYLNMRNVPIIKEPVSYDFMSGTLLIADLMRKVLPQKEYLAWLSRFTPDLFDVKRVDYALKINKTDEHNGYEAHWDGFHLNRIWCLNGILSSLPQSALKKNVRKKWITAMNKMWDYAQESIGKDNYDVDHWLSSFSVFALIGYKK